IGRMLMASISSALLCMSLVIPPLGVVLAPFTPQPVLGFGFRNGTGWGAAVLVLAMFICAGLFGEALALIYGLFAIMSGLLLALLGRIRAIEYLVFSIASVMFVITA